MSALTELARQNRKNPTKAEKKLWFALRRLNLGHFQRQFIINDKYIADFICREKRFIIECDGGQHYTDDGLSSDEARTKYLNDCGYTVIRLDNELILQNIDTALNRIVDKLNLFKNPS